MKRGLFAYTALLAIGTPACLFSIYAVMYFGWLVATPLSIADRASAVHYHDRWLVACLMSLCAAVVGAIGVAKEVLKFRRERKVVEYRGFPLDSTGPR
jgi:hypothetical protein